MFCFYRKVTASVLLLSAVLLPCFGQNSTENGLTVAGIQYEIDINNYKSLNGFFTGVEEILDEVLSSCDPDLIIFPEYTGVFVQLIPYYSKVKAYDSFASALGSIVQSDNDVDNLTDVFQNTEEILASALSRWAELSSEYGVYILAGSFFVPDEEDGSVRNRTYVFNPAGGLEYTQDKVFLTEFETEIVGLEPGKISEAELFHVSGYSIGVSICRDTYFPDWEERFQDAFLWIDIKANGEIFDREQQRSFMRALPARIAESNVDYGMTVCAVGSYLDLLWEGRSSVIEADNDQVRYDSKAETADSYDLIIFSTDLLQ